jgi:hypothetical protein
MRVAGRSLDGPEDLRDEVLLALAIRIASCLSSCRRGVPRQRSIAFSALTDYGCSPERDGAPAAFLRAIVWSGLNVAGFQLTRMTR